jgi:hypothetical protein
MKAAVDTLGMVLNPKLDADTMAKVTDARRQVGETQDTLFQLCEEMFALQAKNGELVQALAKQRTWEETIAQYPLTQTPGGAIVHMSKGPPEHLACPACAASKRELQTLQSAARGYSRCLGCEHTYQTTPGGSLRISYGEECP